MNWFLDWFCFVWTRSGSWGIRLEHMHKHHQLSADIRIFFPAATTESVDVLGARDGIIFGFELVFVFPNVPSSPFENY
jgi:hypothetical protein